MTTVLEQMGGFEKSFIDIANGIDKYTNYDVELVTLDEQSTEKINKFVNIYNLKFFSKTNKIRETKGSVSNLINVKYTKCSSVNELRKKLNTFDLIYSKNEILEALIFKYLVKYDRIPPVIFLCGTAMYYPSDDLMSRLHNFLYLGRLYKHLTKNVLGFHVKNEADAALLEQKDISHRVFTIANPFKFDMTDVDDSLRLKNKKFTILWAARLTKQKGVENLIEIIHSINILSSSNIEWIISGSGELEPEIIKLAEMTSNVTYVGHTPQNEMQHLYNRANIFIMTSLWETFGNTVVEANFHNLPVISYDIDGPKQIIDNGVNGYLADDTTTFINLLQNAINTQLKVSIRAAAVKRFDTKEICNSTVSNFNALLKVA